MKPIDELVAAMAACLPENLFEFFQERAAIREHEAGQCRELAEAMAMLDVVSYSPKESCECWS